MQTSLLIVIDNAISRFDIRSRHLYFLHDCIGGDTSGTETPRVMRSFYVNESRSVSSCSLHAKTTFYKLGVQEESFLLSSLLI